MKMLLSKDQHFCRMKDYTKKYEHVKLPLYWGNSNISNQPPISKCGWRGNTIIGPICFLPNVENRKFHAIPGNKMKKSIFKTMTQLNLFLEKLHHL